MNNPQNLFSNGTAGACLASSEKLKHDTVAALVNGKLSDLRRPVSDTDTVEPVAASSEDALPVIRHSTAHIMADAVQRLFPGTQVTIGPSIDNGFYYDFDKPDGGFTEDDLAAIEKEMQSIIKEGRKFERKEVTREEARELFTEMGETYKLELLDAIEEGVPVSLYYHGDWVDLCAGPHIPNTRSIGAFKLMTAAGAYWRGDEKNKMLSRIYGTAFSDKKP